MALSGDQDQALIDDLHQQGIVVDSIQRTESRVIALAHTAHRTTIVAVVDRGDNGADVLFARFMTKVHVR